MQSADRAFQLLLSFSDEASERGVSELAAELGLHKSTVSRMLAGMQARGLLARSGERYRLGPQIVRLGALALRDLGLLDACRPAMARLAAETGETVNLAVADGDGALNVDQVQSSHFVGAIDWTG